MPIIDKARLQEILIDGISKTGLDNEIWFNKLNKDEVKKYLDINIPPDISKISDWAKEDMDKIDNLYNDYHEKEIKKPSYNKKIKKKIISMMISDLQEEIKKLED